MNSILTFPLLAQFITSWSLIDPPGWIIILTPALIKASTPSVNGKKASDAAIEFLIFWGWNFLAFCIAILQLSNLLGCPAPIPIVEKLLLRTIALDLTYLLTLKVNSISFNSFLLGFNFVTHLSFFLSKIILSLFWTKNAPSKFLILVIFLDL